LIEQAIFPSFPSQQYAVLIAPTAPAVLDETVRAGESYW
jgi:hypothetical protein